MERGNLYSDVKREMQVRGPYKDQRIDALYRGGSIRSSDETAERQRSEGMELPVLLDGSTAENAGGDHVNKTKPFCISKQSVMMAWKKVKANKGTHGIDGESIKAFEVNLKRNLYKVWNRMSSGTYFLLPAKAVEVPKADGGKRMLAIPTVSDRLAQAVAKEYLEPIVEPNKTKIAYCKDGSRQGLYKHESFDFLGYEFRPRLSKSREGRYFVSFLPAVSRKASKSIGEKIRSWRMHLKSDQKLEDLAKMTNSIVQGWVNYYGHYYKSALYQVLRGIERYLVRWVMRKYKRFRGHKTSAKMWLRRIKIRDPAMFVHWKPGLGSTG